MVARGTLLILILALGSSDIVAESIWKAFEPAAAQAKLLEELQSPLHAHERPVVAGTPMAIGKDRFVLALDASGRTVTWTRTSTHPKKDKRSKGGRFRVPGYVTLGVGIERAYTLRARVVEGTLALSSATGLDLPCGGGVGHVVDSDLDGVLGSAGDGYVAPGSRTVGPFSGQAWGPKGGMRYRRREDGSWQRAAIAFPHPLDGDHCAAWSLLQWRRQQCGCLPVAYDFDLEAAMGKHAKYLAMHGGDPHAEDSKLNGYTPEGALAARRCIITEGDASMLEALQMHLTTLYHRTRPLQPGLTHTAMVFHQGISLLDVFSRRGGPMKDALLVYPPHGMLGAHSRFNFGGESPMPVKDVKGQGNLLGTAVGLFSEPLRTAQRLDAQPSITLQYGKRRTKTVAGQLHYPGHAPSARAGASNRGNVAFIPERWLVQRMRHKAVLEVRLPGGRMFTYRWWFVTRVEPRRRRR